MIVLTGYRAAGKTTVGNILDNKGYWLFDVGPYWRSLRDKEAPHLDAGQFFSFKRSETGNTHWEDDMAVEHLKAEYAAGRLLSKDLVISGYRNPTSLDYLLSAIRPHIFPNKRISLWYVHCNFQTALTRYRDRDGNNITAEQLIQQYKYEDEMGIEKLRSQADVFIDNSLDLDCLNAQIDTELKKLLELKVEGAILREGPQCFKERR